jgi:DNA adenine methylase
MDHDTFRTVQAVHPPAPYIGGKRQLAATIVALIEEIPHTTHAEPFIGMGGVFLRRSRVPRAEVINDISGDVTTFFRILQRHYQPFMDLMRFQLASRREFERLAATEPATLTDLERAARFLYLQRLAFGGKVAGRTFGVSIESPARFDVTKLGPLLADVAARLSGVIIENLPFADLIKRYDAPETLFYLDPPYWGSENDYGTGAFTRADFRRLAEILAGIAGKFVLSINDTPEVRSIFAGFDMAEVDLTYSISRGAPKTVGELIITPKGMERREEVRGLFD